MIVIRKENNMTRKKSLTALMVSISVLALLTGCKDKKEPVLPEPKPQTEETGEAEKTDTDIVDNNAEAAEEKDKEESVTELNHKARKAFMAFASDEQLCVSDIDEPGYFRKGNRYSLSDIIDNYLKIENQYVGDDPVELYDATYAYIDCGMDEKIEMALNLNYGMSGFGDYSQRIYLFKLVDDEVHLFADDFYGYRTFLEINEYGYVKKHGAGGANIYGWDIYYFDKDCNRIYLYGVNEHMGLEYPRIPKYYIKGGYNRSDYPDDDPAEDNDGYEVYAANFSECPSVDDPDADFYELFYKDNMYAFCDHNGNPVRPDRDMTEFYDEEGIKWYDYDELNEMLDKHEEELGVTDKLKNADEADFDSLIDDGILKHNYSREDVEESQEDESYDIVETIHVSDVEVKPFISSMADKDHSYNKVTLKQVSCTENDITDDEDWFRRAGFNPPGNDASDDQYNYVLTGDKGYGTMSVVEINDVETGKLKYRFDFSDLLYAKGYEGNDFVERGVRHCFITDDYLYVNLYHSTYAESCPDNAFMMCIDINTGETVWVSEKLTSNSCNFVRWGDNIITGYGFTAEDDYIYILNRFTGEVTEKIKVKKSPDYFAFVDDEIWVRTYSYDYVFKIQDEKKEGNQ